MNRSRTSRGLTVWLPAIAVSLFVPSCGPLSRLDAVPVAAEEQATIPDIASVRYWGDADAGEFRRAAEDSLAREEAFLRASGHQGALPPADFLAISGGGENGAFGAGLLAGWTAAGTRPQFKGVTGISTGALTAPFAFLGPAYDDKLKEVYTTISIRSEEHTSELQSLMRNLYADFCLKKKKIYN